MRCFEKEGSWNLSFSGAGFLGLYHVGVIHCLRQRAPRLLRGASRFYGSSSGALIAVSVVSGLSVDLCCSRFLAMVKQVEQLSLGIFHPAFMPIKTIRQDLQDSLPTDIHILASQRLGISLTHWPDGKNFIVTDFATRDEVIEALVCTAYFPFYCGTIPPTFRGKRYIDGALSNSMPFADSPSTITVSPFHGTVDICPQSSSASIHEMNTFSANFQISTKNLFRGISCFIPSSPEVMADSCRQGYLDALRFLERRGLTKEPVLWSLVSKEPPAPADGTPDAAHDRGLSLNWAVPKELVKNVPDFEQLSPELEAALKKACMRDPSAWASFRCSGPGWALTYLLLPFEYVYFQSRRFVEWLPDMPADLWWMQGLLRSLALEVCSRTKDQLLSLLVTSPLQPKAAPPKDLAKEPRPTHQA
ncbi:patatin-like phospholipase domain-containing protein 5 [Bubalus bubalis]|uniref:patatin-like phospholipase domain-containing protein 5 n=1 Tax=Bubalus bubalis TaxID=89462 RepID=UPI001E1B9B5F|nr:patatin-like phospholipase domain-containing protein 5 [Bubalus bubalis]